MSSRLLLLTSIMLLSVFSVIGETTSELTTKVTDNLKLNNLELKQQEPKQPNWQEPKQPNWQEPKQPNWQEPKQPNWQEPKHPNLQEFKFRGRKLAVKE